MVFVMCLVPLSYLLFQNQALVVDAVRPDPTVTVTQSPANYALRAKLFERDREFENAIDAYHAALAIDSTNIDYYARLIRLLIETDQPAEALVMIEEALEIDKQSDELYTLKAAAHLQYGDYLNGIGENGLGEYGLSAEAGQSAVKLNPGNAEAYAYMSTAFYYQGPEYYRDAKEMADTAFGADPQDPTVLYHVANSYVYNGFYETAYDYLLDALEKDNTLIDARILLAQVQYTYYDNTTAARSTVREALALEPENAALYDQLALFELLAGNNADAQEYAEKAVEFAPDMVRAHAHLGRAYFKNNNNYKDAERELSIATEKYGQPNAQTSLYFVLLGLAQYYQDDSNCPQATQLFEDAIAVSIENSPASISAEFGIEECRRAQLNQP